jgi:hypothetical protein
VSFPTSITSSVENCCPGAVASGQSNATLAAASACRATASATKIATLVWITARNIKDGSSLGDST